MLSTDFPKDEQINIQIQAQRDAKFTKSAEVPDIPIFYRTKRWLQCHDNRSHPKILQGISLRNY